MIFSRLGNFIEVIDERNVDGKFTAKDLKGISINKVLMSTKADISNLNVKNYKILKSNYFTYCTVTSRNGNKISLAYNDGKDCIISSINPVFRVVDEKKLLTKYLMIYFKRPEFDRYARFNSWGSARETFSWEDFCDMELVIPPIEIQKKYVAVYESLLHNLKVYESKLEELKLVCDGYIERLKTKNQVKCIGEYLQEINEKNINSNINLFQGVNVDHEFMEAKRTAKDKESCKIVKKGQFAYNKVLKANNTKLPIALREGDDCLISSSYQVFEVTKTQELMPEYLKLWFDRKETERFAGFIALGTTRDTFDFNDLCQIKIPIPKMEEQNSIVNIMKVLNARKRFVEKLKYQIQNICPILIKGSIEECR